MNVAELQALVNRFGGISQASRASGIPRATIWGALNAYGRKGRPRKSPSLAAKTARLVTIANRKVALVKLYTRQVIVSKVDGEGQPTKDPIASIDPTMLDFVYGDRFDELRDDAFISVNLVQDAPRPVESAVVARFSDYVINAQQASEQQGERPARPVVKSGVGGKGSPKGAPPGSVIVGYLFRIFYEKDQRGFTPQPRDFEWTEPNARVRTEQESMLGVDVVTVAYETYDEYKPDRPPR